MCFKRFRRSKNISDNGSLSEFERDINELKANYELSRIRRFTKFLILGFFVGKNAQQRIDVLTQKIERTIKSAVDETSKLIDEVKSSRTYLVHTKRATILMEISGANSLIELCRKHHILEEDFLQRHKSRLDTNADLINSYNNEFVKQRKIDYAYLWRKGTVSLDDEQQTAIVVDDTYDLVVAAAGSGKTEVLITRIAYLINRKPDSIEPNRILAIAYQRKAKEQIEQRLWQRYDIGEVYVRTFHKLGKEILERSGKIIHRNDIVDENKKYGFIKAYVEEKVHTDPDFYKLFVRYMKTVNDKEEKPTQTEEKSILSYAKDHQCYSINGAKVNSKEEKAIMDFLLTHKTTEGHIEVRYEPDLEGFRPDFYLPKFGIYIEHWGIDREGNVPPWFSQSSEQYRESMEKKKKWFKEHNKTLVETYSYEFNPHEPEAFGELLVDKIKKAANKDFTLAPLGYEEVLKLVWDSQKTPVEEIASFITTAKTYGLYPEDISRKLEQKKWSNKQTSFGKLALKVFREYERQLKNLGKIDFEDMINDATLALTLDESLCEDMYDHILVDEYQDISAQRLKLLKKILERNPNCKLFCVGDDWQSIMGFSGSNLNYFVNFKDYFDHPAVSRICTNYRSLKSIVETGAEVIKHNGDKQVNKEAKSKRGEVKPIYVLSSTHAGNSNPKYFEATANDCLDKIENYLRQGYSPTEILVLTRFMRTKVLGRTALFKIVETFKNLAEERGLNVAVDNAKQSNAIKLLTVHKCKGLEAKVVFVLNVVSGQFGFPSEIEDPSILELAREDNGIDEQLEEERRLFYVALTRAKDDLYIYTQANNQSQFLKEISMHSQQASLTK
jgi:DNA helicase-4